VGVLSIDGGGVRGIIPVVVLERLQKCMGIGVPIQEFFQLAVGTSVGALIGLTMFREGISPAGCREIFKNQAGTAFEGGGQYSSSLLSGPLRLVSTVLRDGAYEANGLENVLMDTYGRDTRMLDASYATKTGTKLAALVATAGDPAVLLFTNYNGIGRDEQRHGMLCTCGGWYYG
jgi:patatin-like phospholipase/acyl hydrolase